MIKVNRCIFILNDLYAEHMYLSWRQKHLSLLFLPSPSRLCLASVHWKSINLTNQDILLHAFTCHILVHRSWGWKWICNKPNIDFFQFWFVFMKDCLSFILKFLEIFGFCTDKRIFMLPVHLFKTSCNKFIDRGVWFQFPI